MLSLSFFPLMTRPNRITDTSTLLVGHLWASQVQLNCNNNVIQTDNIDQYPAISQFKFNLAEYTNYIHKTKRFLNISALGNSNM